MLLTSRSEIKRIMQSHGLSFQKKFGQNFLINPETPRRIAEAGAGENTLEIGPGIGTLTRELAALSHKVVAVEIDSGLMPVLSETLGDLDNVQVINQDILKVDLCRLVEESFGSERVNVCANLPYYITTPVLMHLLESRAGFERITVLVQKEVADRICAPAGSAEYGAITAAVAYYGRAEKLFKVSAGSFMPAPKVDSAVLRIDLYKQPPVEVTDEKKLFRLIKGAFGNRRKTLLNALRGEFAELDRQTIEQAIKQAGLDPAIRGERLDIQDFAGLERIFSEIN